MAEHYFEEELINILENNRNKTLGEIDDNHVFDRTFSNPKIKAFIQRLNDLIGGA